MVDFITVNSESKGTSIDIARLFFLALLLSVSTIAQAQQGGELRLEVKDQSGVGRYFTAAQLMVSCHCKLFLVIRSNKAVTR